MKIISTLVTLSLMLFGNISYAQVFQNFEGGLGSLYGNCWQFSNSINLTSIVNKGGPISGTESMITLPPVNAGVKDYIITPFLNLSSGDLQVSFKYALSTKLAGNAYRLIVVGLVDKDSKTTKLDSIYLDKTSSLKIVNYEKKFTLTSTVSKRLFIEFSGNTGDGNSRLIFDDLFTSVDYLYGVTACNEAPVAVNDAYLGVLGVTTRGNLTFNDVDPDGEITTPSVVTTSADGTLVINTNGTFSFTPSPSFTGGRTVVFTYQLSDNGFTPLTSNVATVTIDYSMSVLACKLLNFDGKLNNGNLSLRWSVAHNDQLKRMEIEQSTNGKDYSFSGTVLATAKTGDENYFYGGKSVPSSGMSYRLKMTDMNNQVSYSKSIAIQSASAGHTAITFVSGLPNQDVSVGFQSVSGEPVKITLIDISGKILYSGTHSTVKGTNRIIMRGTASCQRGVSVVQLHDGAASSVAKFIKY